MHARTHTHTHTRQDFCYKVVRAVSQTIVCLHAFLSSVETRQKEAERQNTKQAVHHEKKREIQCRCVYLWVFVCLHSAQMLPWTSTATSFSIGAVRCYFV